MNIDGFAYIGVFHYLSNTRIYLETESEEACVWISFSDLCSDLGIRNAFYVWDTIPKQDRLSTIVPDVNGYRRDFALFKSDRLSTVINCAEQYYDVEDEDIQCLYRLMKDISKINTEFENSPEVVTIIKGITFDNLRGDIDNVFPLIKIIKYFTEKLLK